MRNLRRALAGLIVSSVLAACALPPSPTTPPTPSATSGPPSTPSPVTLTVEGTFILRDGVVRRDETGCHGTGRRSDVETGGAVVVFDPSGTVVGSATLLDDPNRPQRATAAEYLECTFRFTIGGIPDLPSYQIELPGFGSIEYSREELLALAGRLVFSVGGSAPDVAGLPDLTVAQVADALGLACQEERLASGEVVPWTCLASDADVRYGAYVSARRDGRVLAIHSVVAQTGPTPSDAVALAFLLRVATLPYAGSDPETARLWVTEKLATGGETEIGGVSFHVGDDWPPATRGLDLETP